MLLTLDDMNFISQATFWGKMVNLWLKPIFYKKKKKDFWMSMKEISYL